MLLWERFSALAGFTGQTQLNQQALEWHLRLPGKQSPVLRGCAGSGAAAVAACRALLERFEVAPDQFQVGRTKLFFRAGVLGRLEDAAARINRSAPATHSQPCASLLT